MEKAFKKSNCIELLILFIFLSFSTNLFSQDYYYYSGSKFHLHKRNDKIVVIVKSNSGSAESVKQILNNLVTSPNEVKQADDNIYVINFNIEKSDAEIQNYFARISAREDIVKIIVPVYKGESEKVSAFAADEFIVSVRSHTDLEKLDILNIKYGVRIIGRVGEGYHLKTFDDTRLNGLELSNIYFETGFFKYCEPNFYYPGGCLLNSDANDTHYGQQWALKNTGQAVPTGGNAAAGDRINVNGLANADMDVDLAWDITTGSSAVTIGVFDTGIDSTHPDLLGQTVTGYDAVNNSYSVSYDFHGHGTACAGIIGAKRNNSLGTAGISSGSKIMAFKIFNDADTGTTTARQVRAFDTATVKGIGILSNSWSGGLPVVSLDNALINALVNGRGGLGCIILFSSGNEGRSFPSYPSDRLQVLSVGASTPHDQKKAPGTGNQYFWGGNYGDSGVYDLDIVAPTICYTTDIQGAGGSDPGDYTPTFNGTSCSCPNAAGVAGLILSVNTSLNALQVIEYLVKGCDRIDKEPYPESRTYGSKWNNYLGYGRVNAYNSVRLAGGTDVTPPTINHLNVPSHSSTYPTKVTAEIVDQSGASINSSSPKIIYRTNKNNAGWSAFDSLLYISLTGNNFTFEIPCMGYESEVEYYLTASDNAGNRAVFPRGAPNGIKLLYFAVGTLVQDSKKITAAALPDYTLVSSPTVAYGNFRIADIKAELFVRHNRIKDLIILLNSPVGNPDIDRVCLFSHNPYEFSPPVNINGAKISDSSTIYWRNIVPPYSGAFVKPDYMLKTLRGTNANGNWKVIVADQRQDGIGGTLDSVRLTLLKLGGVTSPSARLDIPADSLINFGMVTPPNSVDRNFYLKNVGTANLNVANVSFSGQGADLFSIQALPAGPIAPNDSGLFMVSYSYVASANKISASEPDANQAAVMNIENNDPSKPVFKVSLQIDNQVGNKSLALKLFIQGFFFPLGEMKSDTVRVYLRSGAAPYSIVDSSRVYLSNTGNATVIFTSGGIDNINYYYQIKHRNALETWSKTPQPFISSAASYDFTTSANKAYGNNQINVGAGYAFYSGDIVKDGNIDLNDLISCYNRSAVFEVGYSPGDVTFDGIIDLTDLIIVFNNVQSFIHLIRP